MESQGIWPVVLREGDLTLRPLRLRDRRSWDQVRMVNREWLSPWEATQPTCGGEEFPRKLPTFVEMVMQHRREGRTLRTISLAIWVREDGKDRFVGQITLGGLVFGALRGAHVGYWIDAKFAGRGITTRAVNLLTIFGFQRLDLHRIEINLRPENIASKRVAEKCGYTFESSRPKFLHIDGQWRDHLSYVKVNDRIR